MAIEYTLNKVSVSTNTFSTWLQLREGENRFSVLCPSWDPATVVTIEQADEDIANTESVVQIGLTDLTYTGKNGRFKVFGPGLIRINVAGIGVSGEITLKRVWPA